MINVYIIVVGNGEEYTAVYERILLKWILKSRVVEVEQMNVGQWRGL
jgi:hypothetical protein